MKKCSIRLTSWVSPPYFFQVDDASEAFDVATSNVTILGGRLNLSKEDVEYPPICEYFGLSTMAGRVIAPGAILYYLMK